MPLAETLNSQLEIKMTFICFSTFLWCTFIQKMLICVIVCRHIIPISLFQYLPTCIVLHMRPNRIHALYTCQSFSCLPFSPLRSCPQMFVFSHGSWFSLSLPLRNQRLIFILLRLFLSGQISLSSQSSYGGNTP